MSTESFQVSMQLEVTDTMFDTLGEVTLPIQPSTPTVLATAL